MAEVLVLVEHFEGKLKTVTAELITAARALGEPSAVVIGGPGTAEGLTEGLKAAGAREDLCGRVRHRRAVPGHPQGGRAGGVGRIGFRGGGSRRGQR